MSNDFREPCVLPNPDNMLVSEIIDTDSQELSLSVWKNGTTSAWRASFVASNTIALTEDAEIEATLSRVPGSIITDAAFMIGFDATNPDEVFINIDYAVYINETLSSVGAYENGALVGSTGIITPQRGDKVSVRKTGTTIEYLYNGVVFHTSAVPVPGTLVLDSAIRNDDSMMEDITLTVDGVKKPIYVTTLVGPISGVAGASVIDVAGEGWHLIRDTMNYALAYGQAQPLWNQHFNDTAISSSTSSTKICEWRIPHASDSHNIIDIDVYATATTAAGVVRFYSANSTLLGTIPVGLGSNFYSTTLDIGTGVERSEVEMQVIAGSGGTIQVHETWASISPLTSPIAAGPIISQATGQRGIPMGAVENGAIDNPLPASKADHIIESLDHLYARPRCIACWAGTEGGTNPSPMFPNLHRWPWVMTAGGHNRTSGPGGRGDLINKVTFYVRAESDPGTDTFVYIQIGSNMTSPRFEITVPAAAPTQWYSLTLRLNELYNIFPEFQHPVTLISIWPSVRGDDNRTNATVLGFSAIAEF